MGALTVPKRDQKRSRVFLSAHVDSGTGPIAARIRDISRTGALVEADFAPAGGETLELVCGSTTLQARVAWADRGWFGVEFFTPLLVGDLVDAAGTKLKVSAPRAYHASEPLQSE
jgi:hypothetical protein